MTVVLIIIAVLIFLITATLFINIRFEYDVLNNVGKIKVMLYKTLILFSSGITISDSYLNLNKKGNKVIKIKIDFNDENFQFVQDLQTYLFHKLYPTEKNFGAVIASENPFIACMMGSTLGIIINLLLARAKNSVRDVKVTNNVQTGFRQNMFKVDIKLSVVLSIYDFLWAFLKAYKAKVRRREKKRRNKQIAKY